MKKVVVTPDVHSELEAVRAAHDGYLRPADVVEAARVEGSALWQYMDSQGLWDKERAHEYALDVAARFLIMRVRVTVEGADQEPVRVRAYVSLKQDRNQGLGYRSSLEVMEADNGPQALLDTALGELAAFRRKYEKLKQLGPVMQAIADLTGEGAAA